MDAQRFDTLSRTLATPGTRRGLLRILPALPLAATVPALVAEIAERAVAHPAERIQKRRDKHRQRARRRQDSQHDQRTRDNGQGNGQGTPDNGQGLGSTGRPCVALGQVCSIFGDPCCQGVDLGGGNSVVCAVTDSLVVTTCQYPCNVNTDGRAHYCQYKFGPDVVCQDNGPACTGAGGECCIGKHCASDTDCVGGGACCPALSVHRCCAQGQVCADFGGCKNP